jgi:hypothetical protein
MKEIREIEYRGWSFKQVLLAALTGAAAGAALVWMSAPAANSARRSSLRNLVKDGRKEMKAMPEALRRASCAAREAFVQSLEEQVGDI